MSRICKISFSPLDNRNLLIRQAVKDVHELVDLPLQRRGVRRGVGLFDIEDAVNQLDERCLDSGINVGDGEFFPVVRVKVGVAAAVGAEEIVRHGRVHHTQQVFQGKAAARLFEVLTPGKVRPGRLLAPVAGRLFQGIVPHSGKEDAKAQR